MPTAKADLIDFFGPGARLALELECLLMDTRDAAVQSRWWASAHEALEQWRMAIRAMEAAIDAAQPVETTLAAPSVPAQPATEQQARWRPEVVAFADAMERKLRANDWKGGWKDFAPDALMDRVREEFDEAQRAHLAYPRDTDEYRQNLLDESADVANMLMMVCDVVGALATPPQEPQAPAQGAEVSPFPVVDCLLEVWRTAMTLANNLAVQVSDRHRDNDENEEAAGASECAQAIRKWLRPSAGDLDELLRESGAHDAVAQLFAWHEAASAPSVEAQSAHEALEQWRMAIRAMEAAIDVAQPQASTTLEEAASHARVCSGLAEQHKDDAVLYAALTDAAAIIRDLLGFRLRDELSRPRLTDADAMADLNGTPEMVEAYAAFVKRRTSLSRIKGA